MRADPDDIRIALAIDAYRAGRVRLIDPDLGGATHVVGTRRGLFVADRDELRLVAHGLYYGLATHGDSLYAFEACDRPRADTARGRIVRFRRSGTRIASAEVIATGLDNGCHQIDVIDDRLCVVDTHNQRIVRYPLEGGVPEIVNPFATAAANDWAGGYAHINSLVAHGPNILVMMHNGTDGIGVTSEIARLDRDWRVIERIPLRGRGCHNISVLEDGSLLSCGSYAGELIAPDGFAVRVCELMTRGLSVGTDDIAVGGSAFADRATRDSARGAVLFLDRSYRRRARLDVPAPVMEIRRLDGRDRTLSDRSAEATGR